jgi:hypothetical protein
MRREVTRESSIVRMLPSDGGLEQARRSGTGENLYDSVELLKRIKRLKQTHLQRRRNRPLGISSGYVASLQSAA